MLFIQPLQRSPKRLHVSEFVLDPKNRSVVRQQWINRLWTSGDPDAATTLVQLLKDKDPKIRFCAAQGLGWLSEDTEIFDAEIRQMKIRSRYERDPRVKEALRIALGAIEQNKKNPKLETPDDPFSEMFVKVDNISPRLIQQAEIGGECAEVNVLGWNHLGDDDYWSLLLNACRQAKAGNQISLTMISAWQALQLSFSKDDVSHLNPDDVKLLEGYGFIKN